MYDLGVSSNLISQTKIESSKAQQTSTSDFKNYVAELLNRGNLINSVSENQGKGLPCFLKNKENLPSLNKNENLFEDLQDIKKIIERLCQDEKNKS